MVLGTRLVYVLTLARTKISSTQVCPISKASLRSWAMNVTSTGNISKPHVLDHSDLKIRIAMHVTCIQKAIGLNSSREIMAF